MEYIRGLTHFRVALGMASMLALGACGTNIAPIDDGGDAAADHAVSDATDASDTFAQPDESALDVRPSSDVVAEASVDAQRDVVQADVPPGTCRTDADCAFGREWCVFGQCVACDNSGPMCDLACPLPGWGLYTRNGCQPCACAPPRGCTTDMECGDFAAMKCYAGAFCWDWCPPGDPTCCYGNVCSAPGCAEPPPTGCVTRGCPPGLSCHTDISSQCASSSCSCSGSMSSWGCTTDCGGGVCVGR